MNGFRQIIGLAAGVAAGALITPACAEPNDGLTFEFAVSAEDIDLMTLAYGRLGEDDVAQPLIGEDDPASGAGFDIGLSGIQLDVLGVRGEAYVRGRYSDASGGAGTSFANPGGYVIIPTGFEGFDEAQIIGDDGLGTIATERDVEQTEVEIAAGFAFAAYNGFIPRIELSYRRGEIDQTLTVDRIGVTPLLEEFATETTTLTSDCAELVLGVARVLPIAANWSLVGDASAGVGHCRNELDGRLDFVDGFNPYTSTFDDTLDGVNVRGTLSAGLIWQLTDAVGLGFDVHGRIESDAPYIAYPTYEITSGSVASFGTIRLETESRTAYGARLSLRFALN